MNNIITGFFLSVFSVALASEYSASEHLWYKQPAIVPNLQLPWSSQSHKIGNLPGKKNKDTWESQTLPVGNGRIGGTIYGGDRLDCVVLNETSLWSGGPNKPNNGTGYVYGPTSGKEQFGSYQPFANLYINYDFAGQTKNYKRALDLRRAEATVGFTADGVRYSRKLFASRPDDVMVYTADANKPGALTADIALAPYHNVSYSRENGNTIIMRGTLANGEIFEGRILVLTKGGSLRLHPGQQKATVNYTGKNDDVMPVIRPEQLPYIEVRGADSMAVYISLATNYKQSYAANWQGEDPALRNTRVLTAAVAKGAAAILESHRRDYASYYNRMHLNLGTTPAPLAGTPTDARLRAYRRNYDRNRPTGDPDLEELIYNYGRYMLISGSQPGNLPVTLQGIWNNKVHAPWACDYHNNINLQMCYWGAEVANLSECHEPLLDFIRAMEVPLSIMTRKEFGKNIRGWTTRISQNPWGGGGWRHWNPPVNAWYALHLWDHYAFTHDREYLKNHAYPILKNICHFWEDRLKEIGDKGAGLHTWPVTKNPDRPAKAEYSKIAYPLTVEQHPELAELKAGMLVSPKGWSHEWGPLEDGCMHDQQLIDELFQITVTAAGILNIDTEWATRLESKRRRLAPNRITAGGYLQEWIVDRPDMVTGQRHTSHLVGVYPGSVISVEKTPELARAAMKSLKLRGLTADNRRSWTWPWRTAAWARFREAEKAYSMVQHYVRYNVLDNLFGNHPPMQMDGTFGMTGGMSEMLIQSHAGVIELLPALPKEWSAGHVRGIKARGNIIVDMEWKDGKVTRYTLTTNTPNPAPVTVLVNGEHLSVTPISNK